MQIVLVTILGLVLRLINIIKPEGLWNDEYVSWMIAATPFKEGFITEILKQCHLPLYYLYLKPFAHYSDIILRLTSVIPSVLAIPVMYLAGKECSEKTGKLATTITAILPFLIYYSQEVRFYSILFLFSALMLLFFIRVLKNSSKLNIVCYLVSSFLVMFTHVLGVFTVFFMFAYLIYKKNILNKKIILISTISLVLLIPLGINILNMIPNSQWWGNFGYTNIMFLFSDFFSPILTNNINAPHTFWYNNNPIFKFLITIPTLIGIIGLISGTRKNKNLIVISLIFISIMIAFAISGKVMFITKYLTEILPIYIYVMAVGFSEIKNSYLRDLLIYTFIGINFLSIFTIFHPVHIRRTEGHNLPAKILNKEKPDNIIYTYYAPDRFKRYVKTDSKTFHISKVNRFEYKDNPERIYNNIKKGESVSLVFLDSVSFIPQEMIKEAEERNLPEMFITFSKIKYNLINHLNSHCDDLEKHRAGSWSVINCKIYK